MARILLAGGTSRLGRCLVDILESRGEPLRLLVRDPQRVPAPLARHELVRADLTDPARLPAACEGVGVVISAAGAPLTAAWRPVSATFDAVDHRGTAALARAAAVSGARRIIYVSVAGDLPEGLGYVDAHRRAEAAIADVLEARIVRATGFQGTLTLLVDLARTGVLGLPGPGHVRTNPIAELDLARAVVEQLDAEGAGVVAVGGPEVLTRREIAATAFEVLGKRPRIVPVPSRALRLSSRLLGPVNPRLSDLAAFFAHIHEHDAVAPAYGTIPLRETFAAHVG